MSISISRSKVASSKDGKGRADEDEAGEDELQDIIQLKFLRTTEGEEEESTSALVEPLSWPQLLLL